MADDMKPITIPQGAYDLYDAYAHGQIDRRNFFSELGKFAVGGVSVAALAGCLMPNYEVEQTREADGAFEAEMVTYASPQGAGQMAGYLVRPSGVTAPLGGVVVIHENRGLNPHIKDVARRAAAAGYVAFAPDALYPIGGYPGTDDEGRELQRQRDRGEMVADFMAAAEFLRGHSATTDKIGCVGFCFGGAVANLMAVRQPWLSAAVPYYGGWPDAGDAAKVEVPLQIHLASEDQRVNAGWSPYEAALKAAGADYEMFMYEGAQHGFHNDTTGRFDADMAALAWSRTLVFFERHLV
ncbi:MAG: dienelactone hydrolase family protein [Pseudomonadota bacterium]